MTATTRAAWYERLGPASEVLTVGDLPAPDPGPGEVLVRVAASGINPSDVKKRAGWHGGRLDVARVVPHSDGAGDIVAVGAGVSPARLGERVWIFNAQHERAWGSAADLVALPESLVAPLPAGVSYEVGACLGVPGCTAHAAVLGPGPVDGLTVLVAGGAGAVGHYAVQLAALGGARVIATVSSAEKAAIAGAAGAADVIDYRRDDVVAAVRDLTSGAGVDRIVEVDLGANLDIDTALVKPRGTVSSYSSTRRPRFEMDYYGFGYKGVTWRFIQVYLLDPVERAAAILELLRHLAHRRLATRIADCYPLDAIAAAHERQECGEALGNVVVTLTPASASGTRA